MKIIFLDIDGVLNTSETFKRRREEYKKTKNWKIEIDSDRVSILKYIINMTGAKVVLSSTWRLLGKMQNGKFTSTNERCIELIKLFKSFGIEIYDITPYIDSKRDKEILKWLKGKDIESFVVIDDESSFLMEFVNNELVKTSILPDGEILMNMDDCMGLSYKHANDAIAILNSNEYRYKKRILKYTKDFK